MRRSGSAVLRPRWPAAAGAGGQTDVTRPWVEAQLEPVSRALCLRDVSSDASRRIWSPIRRLQVGEVLVETEFNGRWGPANMLW